MNTEDALRSAATPAISVVIPCHNSTATIGLQLESLARQSGAPAFEVVVVDNRSTDDLPAAVAPWRDRLDLHLVSADDHANPGYARNVGVAHARATKIAFCDSDDYLASTWVRAASQALDQHPVVNGDSVPTDPEEFTSGADHLDELTAAEVAPVIIPGQAAVYPILLGNTCAFRRDFFTELGGFDVAVPYGIEDNDLALRVQSAGLVIGRAQGMKLAYRLRSESAETLVRAFRGGFRHMLLAHRHDLFGRSPSLPPRWYVGLLRCAGAGVRMVLRPAARDWRNLGRRAALQAGLVIGHLRYGMLGHPPVAQPGVGLER